MPVRHHVCPRVFGIIERMLRVVYIPPGESGEQAQGGTNLE